MEEDEDTPLLLLLPPTPLTLLLDAVVMVVGDAVPPVVVDDGPGVFDDASDAWLLALACLEFSHSTRNKFQMARRKTSRNCVHKTKESPEGNKRL